MDGILLVDKPVGWTSFDVVAKVRGILKAGGLKKPKVGHTGTLDPLASGLLVLLIGSYTKRADDLTKLPKTYKATMYLGVSSTTGDGEGDKTTGSKSKPTNENVKVALKRFSGELQQVPPAYSAVKVNGQRAYKLIRSGVTPALKPRTVHIYSSTLDKYDYPCVYFTATVSSGTYIRSLVSDIGDYLGTKAYMSNLRRLSVGEYSIEDAVGPGDLTNSLIYERILS